MAVVLIEKDPFVEAEGEVARDEHFYGAFNNIRRPFYGTSAKDPRVAYLSVFQDQGGGSLVPISLRNSSAPGGRGTSNHNFILTNVQESRQEKMQVIETFGDHFAYFYGEKPIVLSCSGYLLNTEDFNWKNEWFHNYERYLRGTKAVENRSRVFLGYDDVLVQGYIFNCQTTVSSEQPSLCPFSFQMLLAKPPLDLSPMGGDFSSKLTNYVNEAGDARTLADDTFVEYDLGSVSPDPVYDIDPLTGDSKYRSDASANVPNSTDNPRTASWISERNPGVRQWRNPYEALLELNTKLAAAQTGTDLITSRQRLRESPASFQLASRTQGVVTVGASLGTGVRNSAAVIPDTTGLE